ncbi:MAG: hypothetical protein QG657_1407 [Acidobacteriota bacterium]|nr:hypothetical protein [Acidobacteriota bacterium]
MAQKKNVIIVHSIKGGCGKTTIALGLAQYLGQVGKETESKKVCYIDLDLIGVGTSYLATEDGQKKINDGYSMSDFVLLNPFDNPDFFETLFDKAPVELFHNYFVEPDPDGKRYFRAIFSSSKKEVMDKAVRSTSDLFFAEDIKSKLKVLLEKLFTPSSNNEEIDTVILDTSPGIQGLTTILLELARELSGDNHDGYNQKSKMNKDWQFIKIILATNNISHLQGLKDHFKKEKDFNTIIIINQIPLGFDFKSVPEVSDDLGIAEIKKTAVGDDRLEKFKKCLVLDHSIIDEKLLEAYKRYFLTRDKNFFPSFFAVNDLSAEDSAKIGNNVIVIPDHLSLRQNAASFGEGEKFFSPDYFGKLLEMVNDGHLKNVGEKISETINDGKKHE